jgi:lysine-specific demethylase/histidyl-hydroxylase NO66
MADLGVLFGPEWAVRGPTPVRTESAASDGSGAPPPMVAPALARCVAVDPERFAAAHWGRAPLLSRAAQLRNPDGYRDLFSPADADELLSRRGLRTPFLRVARDGELLPPVRYTGGGGAGAQIGDQVLDERVLGLYADGATLVLQGLHRNWPPLIDFAGRLATELRQPVQVNAYLTPTGNQGFATHYDTHDVFVLQVAGEKHWRVHPPVLVHPLQRQPWGGRAEEVSAVAEGPPELDVVLAPGDALYLPRGWLHSARAQTASSLHLTVGIRALTRYSLVETLLDLAIEEPDLRASLPYGLDVAEPEQLTPELAATVRALRNWLARVDPERVADRLREISWSASRPAPIRPLAQAALVAAMDPDTRIRLRPGLRWRLRPRPAVDDEPARVELLIFDRTISFPAECQSALEALLTGLVTRVGDLPGLDDADRLVLARRLLREAVVVPG